MPVRFRKWTEDSFVEEGAVAVGHGTHSVDERQRLRRLVAKRFGRSRKNAEDPAAGIPQFRVARLAQAGSEGDLEEGALLPCN